MVPSVIRKMHVVSGCLLVIAGYLPSILTSFSSIDSTSKVSSSSRSDLFTSVGYSIQDLIAEREITYPDYIFSVNYDKNAFDYLACVSCHQLGVESEFVDILQSNDNGTMGNPSVANILAQSESGCSAVEQKISSITIADIGGVAGARVVKSKIHSNFYADARKLGVPPIVIDSVIRILSEKIDFRRSLKRHDEFEIVYSKKNEMLYSKIKTKRSEVAVYRMQTAESTAYYFANGEQAQQSVSNNAFGNPLPGRLAISDQFGYRIHPITKRYQHHTGVDLRANYGTPVYAIHAGIVKRSSSYYGYGNCVDIQHKSGYSSRYAHLSKIMTRMGSYVKKGQVIGRVGSTGSSTGPHLHLELARYNRVINPMSVKMMHTEKSVVTNRKKFNSLKNSIQKALKAVS